MLAKLEKSKLINKITQKQQSEYTNVEENIIVKARSVVVGLVCHTSGISELLHNIMEPEID